MFSIRPPCILQKRAARAATSSSRSPLNHGCTILAQGAAGEPEAARERLCHRRSRSPRVPSEGWYTSTPLPSCQTSLGPGPRLLPTLTAQVLTWHRPAKRPLDVRGPVARASRSKLQAESPPCLSRLWHRQPLPLQPHPPTHASPAQTSTGTKPRKAAEITAVPRPCPSEPDIILADSREKRTLGRDRV